MKGAREMNILMNSDFLNVANIVTDLALIYMLWLYLGSFRK